MARKNRPEPTRPPAAPDALSRFARRFALPLALLLIVLALGLRASDLRADPPPDLSWSTGPYTDEALNTYSARNMFLYGTWRVDDFFPFVVYPLMNFLTMLVFRLFGAGFVQVKLLSLLAGAASVGVIYLLVKEDSGPLAGLLAGLGLATSFPLAMYSRLGLTETVQILFLLLTALFYVRGLARPWQQALCGFFAASGVLLIKISSVYVLPALGVAFVWQLVQERKEAGRRRALVRGLLFWLGGVAVAAAVWFVAVFFPHRSDYMQYVLRHSLESPAGHPGSIAAYVLNTFTVGLKSRLVPRLAFTALLGFVALPACVAGRRPGLRVLGLWFTFGLLMLGYMNYRPDRYELMLLPPLIAGFAVALARFLETGTLVPATRPAVAMAVFYAVWLWALTTQVAFYSSGFWGVLRPGTETELLSATAAIAAGVAAAGYAVLRLARAGLHVRSLIPRAVLAAILLVLALRLDITQYVRWYTSRTHRMVSAGVDLDKALPDDAVVGGTWAPALLVSSRKHVLPITDWANADDPVRRFGVTHLVSVGNDLDIDLFNRLNRLHPDLIPQAKIIRQYDVRVFRQGQVAELPLTVYELPRNRP